MVGWLFFWLFGIPWIKAIKKRMELIPIPFFFNAQSSTRIFNLATQESNSSTNSYEKESQTNNCPTRLPICDCYKQSDDGYKSDGITGRFESQVAEKNDGANQKWQSR